MKPVFLFCLLSMSVWYTPVYADLLDEDEYEYVDELPTYSENELITRARGKEKPIVVIIPSYNNKRWSLQNIRSILSQNYTNFRVIYIDDCSTDSTYHIIKREVDRQGVQDFVTLVRNNINRGSLANFYDAIHACPDDAIIVCLDGDDWMQDNEVLAYINQVYQDQAVWLTYGQFRFWPQNKQGYCALITGKNNIRRLCGHATHLKTFYAWLFKRIAKEDLMHDGDFFHVTGDKAMMAPMLEMASDGHFKFIEKVLYVYNDTNPIGDARVHGEEQNGMARIIFSRRPYKPIKLKQKNKLKKR